MLYIVISHARPAVSDQTVQLTVQSEATRSDVLRWLISGSVVLFAHAAAAAYLMSQSVDGEAAGNEFTVEMNFDTEPAAPVLGQMEANQGVQQTQTEEASQASVAQEETPQPDTQAKEKEAAPQVETVATSSQSDVMLPLPTPEKVEPKEVDEQKSEKEKRERSEAHIESAQMAAPIAAQQIAPQAVLTRGVQTDDRATFMSWRTRLASHVQRYKRYPAEAIAQNLHGTTTLTFTIDRRGKVVSSSVHVTSGASLLDHEALILLARAAPLPAAPNDVAGDSFTFTIPVRFNAKR